MGRVHAPPVVGEDVEYAENDNKEDGRPFGFETNSDHSACGETEKRDEYSGKVPFTLEDKTEEQEDKEDTSGEQEAGNKSVIMSGVDAERWWTYYFLRSFSLMEGIPAKSFFRVTRVSVKTITRPPITLKLRRKKLRSKIRP